MEQLGASIAQMPQHLEAPAQRLTQCRRAFRERLAEAAALNDAQTRRHRMDVGGTPFHTRTEVLHWHRGRATTSATTSRGRLLVPRLEPGAVLAGAAVSPDWCSAAA